MVGIYGFGPHPPWTPCLGMFAGMPCSPGVVMLGMCGPPEGKIIYGPHFLVCLVLEVCLVL